MTHSFLPYVGGIHQVNHTANQLLSLLTFRSAAVRTAEADAGICGGPKGAAGEQRETPAAPAPPHGAHQYRLSECKGRRFSFCLGVNVFIMPSGRLLFPFLPLLLTTTWDAADSPQPDPITAPDDPSAESKLSFYAQGDELQR